LVKRLVRVEQNIKIDEDIYRNSSNGLPMLSRSEAVSKLRENKELLELGLMSQKKYDEELIVIKRSIEDRK